MNEPQRGRRPHPSGDDQEPGPDLPAEREDGPRQPPRIDYDDPVEVASDQSFPASDPPGWIPAGAPARG